MRERIAWLRHDRQRLLAALRDVAFIAENCSKCRECGDAVEKRSRGAIKSQELFAKARGIDLKVGQWK